MNLHAFEWRRFDVYLFDIDGTLLNSRDGVHYNSFHSALREVFKCGGRIDNVPVHGNTDIGILRATLRYHGQLTSDFGLKLPVALELMCAEVERNASGLNPELCPSIYELLSSLKAERKLLGVVSGNLERIGWSKLRKAGLRDMFDFGSFSDANEGRADIFRLGAERARQMRGSATSICVVGDTPNDIEAARETGLPVIAVATGIYSAEELRQHAPTLCVPTCAVLLKLQDAKA